MKSPNDNAPCPRSPNELLPNPRRVSRDFHTAVSHPSTRATLMVMQWGQFLDHDLTLTPETEEEGCCTADGFRRDCFPIHFPSGDPVFGNLQSQTGVYNYIYC